MIQIALSLVLAVQAQPAPPPRPSGTTEAAADQACRGQIHRRIGETRAACVARLIETDALSAPLGQPAATPTPACRRESVQGEDGASFRFSITCQEVVTTGPADGERPR